METESALVRTDRAVHLHAVAPVDLHLALVVDPRNAENHHPFGFGDAFQNLHLLKHGVFEDIGGQRLHDFAHGLMKFFLSGILGCHLSHEVIHVLLNMFFHSNTLYGLSIRIFDFLRL